MPSGELTRKEFVELVTDYLEGSLSPEENSVSKHTSPGVMAHNLPLQLPSGSPDGVRPVRDL